MELNRINYLSEYPLKLNRNLLLTRLGFKKTKTIANDFQFEQIDIAIEEAFKVCKPKFVYCYLPYKKDDNGKVKFGKIDINSTALLSKLGNSNIGIVMGGTLGKDIDMLVSKEFSNGNYTKAVIIDHAASCIFDEGIEWTLQCINKELSSSGLGLNKFRISPGQLDIQIELQKELYSMLELDKLNVSINESYMLNPLKSAISITGAYNIK